MARSVTTIYNTAVAQYVANAASAGIAINPSGWSMYNYQRLIFWTMAFCQSLLEQIQDAFKSDIQAIQKVMPPQTPGWFQNQVINVFEYDATAVPIVQLDETTNFVPYYPAPNNNFNIVKYCSVTPGPLGSTLIKVAGAGPSQLPSIPITSAPIPALQTFVNTVGVPGLTYRVTSDPADKLFMQIDVFYNGLYSAIISANVIAAINAYLAGIPFDGNVTLSDLEGAIKAVPGVIDIMWGAVQARADITTVGFGTNMVTATYNGDGSVATNTQIQRTWPTVAGYIIPESTTGSTWQLTDPRAGYPGTNNLNFIAQ